jgi:hypothetical protein
MPYIGFTEMLYSGSFFSRIKSFYVASCYYVKAPNCNGIFCFYMNITK